MFKIEDKTIHLTRGDIAAIRITAKTESGEPYTFQQGDIVRLQVMKAKDVGQIVLSKSVPAEEDATSCEISLTAAETTIGDLISKPVIYWYEIEINPDTRPQTVIGYDADGPKELILYPEGADQNA